jgi:hypothetical protein
MSRPKNGTPVRPIWKRGSVSFVFDSITNARPVIGSACAVPGKEILNCSPSLCAEATLAGNKIPNVKVPIASRFKFTAVLPSDERLSFAEI